MRRYLTISMVALALAACSSRYDPQGEPTMYSHFGAADDIHAAVIDGDLRAVKEPATWLAEHDIPSLPEGSESYLAELQGFARQAEQATSLGDAAHAMGGIAKTCGSCHQENIAEPVTAKTAALERGRGCGHPHEQARVGGGASVGRPGHALGCQVGQGIAGAGGSAVQARGRCGASS